MRDVPCPRCGSDESTVVDMTRHIPGSRTTAYVCLACGATWRGDRRSWPSHPPDISTR